MKSLLISLLTISLAPSASPAQSGDMIRNGGFELDVDGNAMADHWYFAGDEGVTATWTRDAGFTGQFSQQIACTRFRSLSPASHVMLCQTGTVRLEKGKWYRISFAAKQQGIPSQAVHVAICDTKSWTNCGLQQSFRAKTEWREFEFTFGATQTISDRVRLQFWYTSIGSFWLDKVRLEPAEPVAKRFTEVVPPSRAVNLLRNSSFECGMSGWGSIAELPGWGGNLNLPVGTVDTTMAEGPRFAGTQCHGSSFRIALTPETAPEFYFDYFPLYRLPVKAPLLANRGWIAVEPGERYTLSAYMKADRNDLAGVLSIRQAFRGSLRRRVRLATDWQRHSFIFRPQAGQVFVALGLDLEASKRDQGTVWIDAVQLEKSPQATPYQPRVAVEVGVETDRLGNLFPHGSEPRMTAKVFNSDQVTHSATLHIRTTDFDDAVAHDAAIKVDVAPGRTVTVPIPSGVRQKGFYRLHLQAENAEVAPIRPMRFAIIEPYAQSDSLFGMNHAYPWPHLLGLSKSIGLCWFRDWSLKWHDVEPEKGKYNFREADHQINRVLQGGLNVLPLLPFPSSNWSSSAPAELKATRQYPASRERIAYMPRDPEDFGAYVRRTVQHYRGRLHVWEILNEPIYTSYALPQAKGYQVKDYIELLHVAYDAVKRSDPNALVIGGIAGGPTRYTGEFIEGGGLRWVDALNLHSYPGLQAPQAYEEPLRWLREQMRSAGADKPIWFTEGAYYADDDKPSEPHDSTWLTPVDSEIEAAEWQVKFNTLLFAYGAEKIIYHSGTPGSLNDESLSGIFFEWAGAPRKMLATQVAMANLLVPPLSSLGHLESRRAGIQAYGFQTRNRTVIVAWAKDGTEASKISLAGKPWRAVDIQGNGLDAHTVTLTERPIYFVAEGKELPEFPW